MRLFAALDIPEEVRSSLAVLSAELRRTCIDARWARIQGLHVTLKFIGETPPENATKIQAALASVPPRPAIRINFRGLGFFPSERRPRVLWAGVEAGSELTALASAVETTLESTGIRREARAYSPHLTLARFDPPHRLDVLHAAIEKAGPLEFGDTTAREFHLYQSILKSGGAEYTRLATFSFAGREQK